MAKKLFVAGLEFGITDEQLQTVFSQFGTVESAKVIIDHDTGRSKGFGFVEMGSDKEAEQAMAQLNETLLEGRTLMVKEARPKGESTYPRNNNFGGGRGDGRNDRNNRNKRTNSGRKSW